MCSGSRPDAMVGARNKAACQDRVRLAMAAAIWAARVLSTSGSDASTPRRDCRRPWRVVRRVRGLQNRRLFLLVELLKRVEQLENLCKLGVRRAAHSGDAAAMLRLI